MVTKDNNKIKLTKPKVGVFVDASNIYFSEKRAGWKIDYKKLKTFLSFEFSVEFMKYYVAIPKESDQKSYEGKMSYLEKIRDIVEVIEKPLKYIKEKIVMDGITISRVIKKGDVDVDITVAVMSSISDLDVVVILSGDSDYIALRDDVIIKRKKILFMAHKKNLSHEIRQGKYIILQSLKSFISYTKKGEKNETPALSEGTLVTLLYSSEEKSQGDVQ